MRKSYSKLCYICRKKTYVILIILSIYNFSNIVLFPTLWTSNQNIKSDYSSLVHTVFRIKF